ncbi:MAG: hypothetical protein K2O34_09895 [Acetatifactor sp.]|nr:hypothetical protein [Acetatifactor sp.]
MGYGESGLATTNVYPVQNVLQLVIMGVPCVALGVLSMSDSPDNSRGRNMLLVIYSSVMLVLGQALVTIGGVINNMIVARTMGAEGLANMSIISSAFSYIQFAINLSLVLLLLCGAFGLGGELQNHKKI